MLVLSLTAVTSGALVGSVSVGVRLLLLGLGTIGTLLGVAMLARHLVRPLARLVGWPNENVWVVGCTWSRLKLYPPRLAILKMLKPSAKTVSFQRSRYLNVLLRRASCELKLSPSE